VLVPRRNQLLVALALGAALLVLGPSAGSSAPATNVATAQAFAVKIIVPNQPPAIAGSVAAPKDSVGFGAGFSYPADGSVLTSGSVTSSASADPAQTATSSASAEVTDLSLFGGEVTVQRVDAKVSATADATKGIGDFTGTAVTGIGGSAVVGNQLGTWGVLTIGAGTGAPTDTDTTHAWRGSVIALDIKLTADHGGLPAGSEIMVGFAAANVQASSVAIPTTTPTPSGRGIATRKPGATQQPPEPRGGLPGLPFTKIPNLHPKLTAGGYVFPVYGESSYIDTFGAARADVTWHHGDDIFAPLGAPLLAVADGIVFSVGWNNVGGWRLWLRDRQGNQFYYAHLSAFSQYAVNGAHVKAGTVVGFVGNTGDAEGTPYHVHFEIHPVGLLAQGYDGAVDPTPYLDAWRHLQDIRFAAAAGWAPNGATGAIAPQPGAILLQVSDISTASGLDPGSLRRALAPVSREGDAALVGGIAQPTSAGGVPTLSRG
jgi:murein DD-endopeptidase MepM/ murein hydrolase activator NlpD